MIIEAAFESMEGVSDVVSGYMGGDEVNPTYKDVSSGKTGHREVVHITYDPKKVSYTQLLNRFWRQIDPTDSKGQFTDKGFQYTTAIFYHNKMQQKIAQESLKQLDESEKFKEKIATEILPAKDFYRAEEYHQDYYMKNPVRYKFYRYGCGRDKRLRELWGDSE